MGFALPQQLYQRCGSVLHLPLNLAVLVYLPHHLALLVHFPHKLAVLVCSTTLTLWRGSLHPTPMFKCGIQPALSLTWHQICRPGFELACVRSRLPGRRVFNYAVQAPRTRPSPPHWPLLVFSSFLPPLFSPSPHSHVLMVVVSSLWCACVLHIPHKFAVLAISFVCASSAVVPTLWKCATSAA